MEGRADLDAVNGALKQRIGELEADKAELLTGIARLQRELEAARG